MDSLGFYSSAKSIFTALVMAFYSDTGSKISQQELYCVAEAVYFEARAESHTGKVAVAHVIKNRKYSGKYPDTYCGVVYEGPKRESWKTRQDPTLPDHARQYYLKKDRCQFSYACDGKREVIWTHQKNGQVILGNEIAWRDAVNVAIDVISGQMKDPTRGATHYANLNIVDPLWASQMKVNAVIGNHTFFSNGNKK